MFETYFFSTLSLRIDLDTHTFLSLISTRRPGPKGQGWNMIYAADVVVVVRKYIINLCAIKHYYSYFSKIRHQDYFNFFILPPPDGHFH